jgi:hypothetical protein
VSNDSTHSLHISDKIVKQLDEELNLTEEQEAKVYPLMFTKVKTVRNLRHQYHGKKNAQKLNTELGAVRNQFTMDLRKILSADQFKQYKKFVKQVRSHHKKNGTETDGTEPEDTHENNVL